MKKAFTSIIVAILLIATLTTTIACTGAKNGSATAYGLVHDHYVGKVEITVEAGAVSEISFDEMQLPYNWAQVNNAGIVSNAKSGTLDAADFAAIGKDGTTYMAKKIQIGDEILSVTVHDDGYISTARGAYANSKINNIEKHVIIDENAKWYWDQMAAGKYWILKADNTKYDIDFSKDASAQTAQAGATGALTKENRFQKSVNGYWGGTNYPLGWKGNMDAIAAALIGKDLNKLGKTELNSSKAWVIGDATSTATLLDLNQYLSVAIVAFNKV